MRWHWTEVLPDTGFDMINLDSDIVARYYQDVLGANSATVPGQYTFPCNASLPDLTLTISGSGITIRGHVLNYHPYDIEANSELPLRRFHLVRKPGSSQLTQISQSAWVRFKAPAPAAAPYSAKRS